MKPCFQRSSYCTCGHIVSVQECQARWRVLRERYVRIKKKQVVQRESDTNGAIISKYAQNYKAAKEWPLYDHMTFLDIVIRHRRYGARCCYTLPRLIPTYDIA